MASSKPTRKQPKRVNKHKSPNPFQEAVSKIRYKPMHQEIYPKPSPHAQMAIYFEDRGLPAIETLSISSEIKDSEMDDMSTEAVSLSGLKLMKDVPMKICSHQTTDQVDAATFQFLGGTVSRRSKNTLGSPLTKETDASMTEAKEKVCDLVDSAKRHFVDGNNDDNQDAVEDLEFDEESGNKCLDDFVYDDTDDATEEELGSINVSAALELPCKNRDDCDSSRWRKFKMDPISFFKSGYVEDDTVIEAATQEGCGNDSSPESDSTITDIEYSDSKTASKNEENFTEVSGSSGGSSVKRNNKHSDALLSDSAWASILKMENSLSNTYKRNTRSFVRILKALDYEISVLLTLMENPATQEKAKIAGYVDDILADFLSFARKSKQEAVEMKEAFDDAYPVNLHPDDDAMLRALYGDNTIEFESFMKFASEILNHVSEKYASFLDK